jgi:hypothetical protein
VNGFNRLAPGHGWRATPGQPIPRAARQPAANGLLLVMLLLVWFSPLSIVVWLLGQAVILLQRRWHWWRFTLASLVAIGVVLAVTGPEDALRRHIFVPQHFWQYVALHFGFGPPGPASPSASSSGTWSPPRSGWRCRWGCWPRRCRCGTPSGPPARRGRVEPLGAPPPAHRPARPRPAHGPAAGQAAGPQAHGARARSCPGWRPGQLAARPLRGPAG